MANCTANGKGDGEMDDEWKRRAHGTGGVVNGGVLGESWRTSGVVQMASKKRAAARTGWQKSIGENGDWSWNRAAWQDPGCTASSGR